MDVAVLSGDPMFVTAAEGMVGAMGHRIVSAGTLAPGGVTVCDVVTMESPAVLEELDPMRAVLFVAFRGQRGLADVGEFVHVHARAALAVELPKVLALLAEPSTVW